MGLARLVTVTSSPGINLGREACNLYLWHESKHNGNLTHILTGEACSTDNISLDID